LTTKIRHIFALSIARLTGPYAIRIKEKLLTVLGDVGDNNLDSYFHDSYFLAKELHYEIK
jgi:hypothetical protein